MKKLLLPVLIVAFLGILMLPTSCKKSSDDTPVETSKMVGTWRGITGLDTIEIGISQPGAILVTYYKYSVTRGSLHFSETRSQSTGLATVTNLAFNLPLGTGQEGPAYISGTFDSRQDTLIGSYAVYNPFDTITRYTGTYLALKIR
jgi:hypothetical protein